jgi:hypothetical protein
MPRPREKSCDASTMFASMSTCGLWTSSSLMRCIASAMPCEMSRMMIVFVRSSNVTAPRSESTPFTLSTSDSSARA